MNEQQTVPKPVKSYREQNLALAEKFDDYLGARGYAIALAYYLLDDATNQTVPHP